MGTNDAANLYFECAGISSAHSVVSGIAVLFTGRLDEQAALRRQAGQTKHEDVSCTVRAAYLKWGAQEFATHLYGDFSIVVWDSAARRLVLARSPSGHYPLVYSQHGPEVHFAATPQALPEGTRPQPDERALAEWLVLRPQLSDRTFFADVRRVSPGTSLVFEQGRLSTSRNWRPESVRPLHLRDHREYADALRETLQAAVRDRLPEGNGDVAAQLSGGLDSSSVTALAAVQLAQSGRSLLAFTAVPGAISADPVEGRFFNESEHAKAVAAQFSNVVHTCVSAGQTPLFHTLDRYTDVEATPPYNPHHLQWIDATYAAAAASGPTTLLTGSMGNMTISAGGSFAAPDALQHGRFVKAAKLFAADMAGGARRLRHVPGTLLVAFAPRVLDLVDRARQTRSSAEEFTGLRPEFAYAQRIDLARWDRRLPWRTAGEQARDGLDRFDFGMFYESPRRLYGLNATDPTFDRRVAELTLSIPLEQFCANGVPRALIRTAMEGRLPDIVRLERRRGLQSADFLTMLERERAAIAEELTRMGEIDLLRRALNIPLLQERLAWPAARAIAYGWHPYSNRLMRAVSVGRFVRRMLDGTLFATLEPKHPDPDGAVHIRL